MAIRLPRDMPIPMGLPSSRSKDTWHVAGDAAAVPKAIKAETAQRAGPPARS